MRLVTSNGMGQGQQVESERDNRVQRDDVHART